MWGYSSREIYATAARTGLALALLTLAVTQVVLGVAYLTEDLLEWSVAIQTSEEGSGAAAAASPRIGGSVVLGVCLVLGSPILLAGALVVFRAAGRYLVEAAAAVAVLCGALGLWLTTQWLIYAASILVGVAAGVFARVLPRELPASSDPEQDQATESQRDSLGTRSRQPYDTGDKFLIALICVGLLALVVAMLWGA